jgi:DNA repair protein RadC
VEQRQVWKIPLPGQDAENLMFKSQGMPDTPAEAPETAEADEAAALARRDRRDRLQRYGPGAWSVAELLSCVLGPGGTMAPGRVAESLLAGYGDLGELASATPILLARRSGMGPARCERLLAAFELGFRAREPVARQGLVVRRPEDLHPLLRKEFRGLDRERFLALFLDSRHRVQSMETVSIGSLNASLVHPREVFKPAVALSAAAVIVAHNHPSGNARPSGDDLELTARLDRCGELLGVALLDHLVVGDTEVTSIREYGWPTGPDT